MAIRTRATLLPSRLQSTSQDIHLSATNDVILIHTIGAIKTKNTAEINDNAVKDLEAADVGTEIAPVAL